MELLVRQVPLVLLWKPAILVGSSLVVPIVASPFVRTLITTTEHHLPAEFWVLATLAVVADLRPFSLLGSRRWLATVFLSVCFTFAITLLWGPVPAIVVQTVAAVAAALRLRFSVGRTLFTTGRLALAFVAAGVVLDRFGPAPLAAGV